MASDTVQNCDLKNSKRVCLVKTENTVSWDEPEAHLPILQLPCSQKIYFS
jgi:hypothetical protein